MTTFFSPVKWLFPLKRPHAGLPLGNGRMGVLAWGEGNRLRLTLARADFWDRRGDKAWKPEMNYRLLRELLEKGDEKAISEIFSDAPRQPGFPRRSSVLPIGRVDLIFAGEVKLLEGRLDCTSGIVTIATAGGGSIKLELSVEAPLLEVTLSGDTTSAEIRNVPAWTYLGEYFRSISFSEPAFFEGEISGWKQATPADATATVAWRRQPQGWRIAVTLEEETAAVLEASLEKNAGWWRDYWSRVPTIDVPEERYRFLYTYGLYKFAGLTNPAGPAATLQGPWVEDYQMPPWSNDYHFNINVQMCYAPAYQAGLTHHLLPLFDMIEAWLPRLQGNARLFAGIEDGYMLPHAVDDRGGVIGSFWTGTIDHGCTAWVARMMFDYWLYSGDRAFLQRLGYPFMVGAMRVYEEMLERKPDGTLSFPVSVSPEYRAARMNAWGRDASFQLAACHMLAEMLQKAAAELGESPRPIWQEIRDKLPLASLVTSPYATDAWERPAKPHLALWEGLELEHSHRHHSFLAGICPFDVFPLGDPGWDEILKESIGRWHKMGMGNWSGWCISWAAMIHHRAGNPDMAVALMKYWEAMYTNEGYGTGHDARFPNRNFDHRPLHPLGDEGRSPEIMQMDAGMGAVSAILDALLMVRRGVHFLFQGAPSNWRHCVFERIRGEGGFAVSARRDVDGVVEWVHVAAERDGEFRLASPWADPTQLEILSLQMKAGETRELRPPVGYRAGISVP